MLVAAARGLSVASTAAELGRTVETVKTQRKSLLRVLDAANMTQAVAVAYERGILGAAPAVDERPISCGKRDAFHAKCSALDRRLELESGTTKSETLKDASERFGREISSVNDLTSSEASVLLDELEMAAALA